MTVMPATTTSQSPPSERGQRADAEDIDDDLEDGEDAGLDHRHGVEERRDRRRRDHRRGQPEVQRHHRRLGRAEDEQREQDAELERIDAAAEDAARGEVEGARDDPGPGDGRKKEHGRGAEQHHQVEPAGGARLAASRDG